MLIAVATSLAATTGVFAASGVDLFESSDVQLASPLDTGRGDPPVSPSEETPDVDAPGLKEVSEKQASNFRILREDQNQKDRDALAPGTGMYGANFALARTLWTAEGPVSVVPGQDAICLYEPDGGSCVSVDAAVDGKLILSTHLGNELLRAFMLVPDGVSDVMVSSEKGPVPTEVTRNVVVIGDPKADAVAYETREGKEVVEEF